jgi:hypothetical protein
MNGQNTWLACVLGIIVFSVGIVARQYMVVRLYGWSGYLASQRDLTEKYRVRVREQHAPSWPIYASFICLTMGVVIVFASILMSK